MKAFRINKPILVQSATSNIDVLYGPYEGVDKEAAIAEALDAIVEDARVIGRTFAINVNDQIEEYWFNDAGEPVKKVASDLYGPYADIDEAMAATEGQRSRGTTIGIVVGNKIKEYQWMTADMTAEPVEKIEELNLTIYRTTDETINVSEGNPVVLGFSIDGRSIISKGSLYQVVGGVEVFISEFSNLGKGNNSVTVPTPELSGVYTYRIRVTDTAGYYAKTADDLEYIQYTVKYGGISVAINTTNLDRIQIKNIQSVAEQYFTLNISVRDSSFLVSGVYLSDGGSNNVALLPYSTLTDEYPGNSYIGFNYYKLPAQNSLTNFDGKLCYIKIIYREDGAQQQWSKEIFTLLKTDSLEIVSQTAEKNYYVNFSDYFTFLLVSGVQNLSVNVSLAVDSDFRFDPVTVSTYNNFSLRVIPTNITSNAQLKMVCGFNISGVQKTYTFTIPMGEIKALPEKAYYIPELGGTVSLDKIIDAQEGDLVDGTSYYRILNDFVSELYLTCAFIADIYCKINQVNDKTLKYVRILQGEAEIGYITEDVISCRGIITDTPLNEWTQIGFGYNVEESVNRSGVSSIAQYFAIYINGMVVKNIKVDADHPLLIYDRNTPITIELGNGINVLKCFIYYTNNASNNTISPKADISSIIYTNYLANNSAFSEPGDLPVLRLMRITDENTRQQYFDLIKQQNEDLRYLTKFGSIGLTKADTMSDYDRSYDNNVMDHDNATLFRQSVGIKKPAQKEYATLCRARWMNGNVLDGVVVEVHTQGTSTLAYAVPNFKFTFWKLSQGGTLERFYPNFIEKGVDANNNKTYYRESIYTAKADFMDSSHLNNTPTCNFYNNLIQDLIEDDTNFPEFEGSPSARNGGIDAIMGFPIVLEISDSASGIDDGSSFINIGSFMLNVDKTGDSLNFEVNDNGQLLSCISFEGTSNDNEHGAAGRFIKDSDLEYYNSESEIETSAQEISTALADANKKLSLDAIVGGVTVRNHKYVKWCKFLSDGLEYRYPDSDIYKTDDNNRLTKIMKVSDFKKLYKMWLWVSKSDSYDNETYKTEFVNHFDLDYCMLYFIQLMVFAQTDNLGKNAMFDCWDGEHWYPRPYDLDSQAGLDNNGNDNIAPFVEIKPEFSLNYNPEYTEQELEDNYLLQNSKISYGGQLLDRYHFSSNTSKLWINFYKNFKSQIETFYSSLRENANYTPDAIISLCKDTLIDKLGINQYNKDFENKYLATDDQSFAYGNRWYKFKKWMVQRFAFCDSYFHVAHSTLYDLISAFTYSILVESPQYVIQSYQDSTVVKFVIDHALFSAGSGAATKIALQVNQGQVLDTDLFKYVSYRGSTEQNFTGIIKLDVSGNKQISGIGGLVGTNLPNLKELNISNSGVTTLNNIPVQLNKLIAEGVQLNSVEFPVNCLVEEIDLKNSTITGNISFNRLPNLKKLDLTNCQFVNNITLSNLPSLEQFVIEGAKFNGNITIQNEVNIDTFDFSNINLNSIVFDGNNINIKKLNFYNTTFILDTINLDAISSNVEELYFNDCQNLKHLLITSDYTLSKLKTFSIYDSSIEALGIIEDEFDASKINNISSLKRVNITRNSSTGAIVITEVPFTFERSRVKKIVNINWNGSGANLFYQCTLLESITGLMVFTSSINNLFRQCKNLSSIPTATITINNSVINASYAFVECDSLPYASIENVVAKCTNVTDFTYLCWYKDFPDDTVIKLDTLFGNNVAQSVTLFGAFCAYPHGISGHATPVNKLVVTGKIKSNVVSTARMFDGVRNISVPYDILDTASNLQTLDAMFAGTTVLFTNGSSTNDILPVYDDPTSGTITLTKVVTNRFFQGAQNSIKSLVSTFYSSNVEIINALVFNLLVNLENCSTCFALGSPKSFSYVPDGLRVDSMWANNSKLTNISGCFNNIKNVTCSNTLRFHNSVNTINISGLFGLSSAANDDLLIPINISAINPNTVIFDNSYYRHTQIAELLGVFENRKVKILDSETDTFAKLSGACKRLFYGATLYFSENHSQLNLSNVTNCNRMFASCNSYQYDSETGDPSTTRKYLDVTLPTSCAVYAYMFSDSNILNDLPRLAAGNAENTSYMFLNCKINTQDIILPANYFSICSSRINNVEGMFKSNKYIAELEYNYNIGLFDNCLRLANVQRMFENCYYLHKGIPNNIFGSASNRIPNVTNISYMFKHSSIFYDVPNEAEGGKKWIDSNTIVPLVSLTTAQETFSNIWIGSTPKTGYGAVNTQVSAVDLSSKYIIDPQTFANVYLYNANRMFRENQVISGIAFKFLGFDNAEELFCASSITAVDATFVLDQNIPNIINASRMFYSISEKEVANVTAFITKLANNSSAKMQNIAGNLTNEGIDDTLKQSNGIIYNGWHNVTGTDL